MKFDNKLFESIITESSDSSDIFDQIADQEEKLSENADLYDVFMKLNKVLESPSRYNEIQSVAPAIDVNRGLIRIDGICKHDVKVDARDLNQMDDAENDNQYVDNVVDLYVKDIKRLVPKTMSVDYELIDDDMVKMDKRRFVVVITRKG